MTTTITTPPASGRPTGPRRCGPVLTGRDHAILRELFDSRVLGVSHLAAIHFSGSREAAKKRLQSLRAAGLIRARPRQSPNEPEALFLTKRGFETLQQSGGLNDYPKLTWAAMKKRVRVSPFTMRHEMAVADVKSAFHAAARSHAVPVRVEEFSTWPRLNQFKVTGVGSDIRRSQRQKPDGFARLRVTTADGEFEHTFFVELDRSTETQSELVNKIARYRAYFNTGGYAKRIGLPAESYRDAPFRCLFVFEGQQRLLNAAMAFAKMNPPIRTLAWLATLVDVRRDPFGSIWQCPIDIKDGAANVQKRPLL